jgi:hypothetical protein
MQVFDKNAKGTEDDTSLVRFAFADEMFFYQADDEIAISIE